MSTPLKLLCILAHPDDETFGTGSTLAKYHREGVETYLITATRGERGWPAATHPGFAEVARIRTKELEDAAAILGIRQVTFLNYIDGDLDQANRDEAIAQIVAEVRRVRPQVVITFDPFGNYGHPDHIAISQFTQAALILAAAADYTDPAALPPHQVAKLYYLTDSLPLKKLYQQIFGPLNFLVDDVIREAVGWPDWAITTRIDGDEHWERVWWAVACHSSQLPDLAKMEQAVREHHTLLLGQRTYYRAYSLVNSGREPETDLFVGLR
ncbi:MAG: PIG-L family deacetylase [Anaerolineae bacterium]|nr:PIG-L family deacetylase [Anaerolineae bacterium]